MVRYVSEGRQSDDDHVLAFATGFVVLILVRVSWVIRLHFTLYFFLGHHEVNDGEMVTCKYILVYYIAIWPFHDDLLR